MCRVSKHDKSANRLPMPPPAFHARTETTQPHIRCKDGIRASMRITTQQAQGQPPLILKTGCNAYQTTASRARAPTARYPGTAQHHRPATPAQHTGTAQHSTPRRHSTAHRFAQARATPGAHVCRVRAHRPHRPHVGVCPRLSGEDPVCACPSSTFHVVYR